MSSLMNRYLNCFVDVFMIDRFNSEPCFINVTIEGYDENFIEIKLTTGKFQLVAIKEIEVIVKK